MSPTICNGEMIQVDVVVGSSISCADQVAQ